MLGACDLLQRLADVLRLSDGHGDLAQSGVYRGSCCLRIVHVVSG